MSTTTLPTSCEPYALDDLARDRVPDGEHDDLARDRVAELAAPRPAPELAREHLGLLPLDAEERERVAPVTTTRADAPSHVAGSDDRDVHADSCRGVLTRDGC